MNNINSTFSILSYVLGKEVADAKVCLLVDRWAKRKSSHMCDHPRRAREHQSRILPEQREHAQLLSQYDCSLAAMYARILSTARVRERASEGRRVAALLSRSCWSELILNCQCLNVG